MEALARRRGLDRQSAARELIEAALQRAEAAMQAEPVLRGYRWKDVTLPEGTELSFTHRGVTHLAVVRESRVVHEGRQVSPSQFINRIAGPGRNAWIGLWVRRPGDAVWLLADDLRRAAEMAFVAQQAIAMRRAPAAETGGLLPARPPAGDAAGSAAIVPTAAELEALARVSLAVGEALPLGIRPLRGLRRRRRSAAFEGQ